MGEGPFILRSRLLANADDRGFVRYARGAIARVSCTQLPPTYTDDVHQERPRDRVL